MSFVAYTATSALLGKFKTCIQRTLVTTDPQQKEDFPNNTLNQFCRTQSLIHFAQKDFLKELKAHQASSHSFFIYCN